MNSSDYRVRRATLDDLGQLMALWASMRFACDDLARRITEFQVAEGANGLLIGAVGLQITDRQGWIHSEAFKDFALADRLRPLLWGRIQVLATNQGLARLWTRESAPFWRQCGLAKADREALERLPAPWGGPAAPWLTLKLRGDLDAMVSADAQLTLFMAAEKQQTARMIQRARVLKHIATLVAFLLLLLVMGGAAYLAWRNRLLTGR
jgi:N-acetylglutamate synthase-like GNAT family acetyltransferase